MLKIKHMAHAAELVKKRQDLVDFTNAIAKDTRETNGRKRGEVLIRNANKIEVYPDLLQRIPPNVMLLFIDKMNSVFLGAGDAMVQDLGKQLEAMGVDVRD